MFSVGPGDHAVVFYQENELARLVGEYLHSAISGGGAAVVVATPEHRAQISKWLSGAGIDVPAAWADGSYVLLDADETMRRFVIDGRPDAAAFWATMSPVVAAASRKPGQVRVFGEMVAVLWDMGLVDTAVELEALWNEISKQYPFTLLCAYPAGAVSDEADSDSLAQVCSAHSAVVGAPPRSVQAWLPD
ncbi:MAG TPA: MEDS domain-containing protein [Streptosporangiaceae bacterium]|nr:MEDS domain-containing protein [Streptosporangiaceae bacterium]